MRSARNQVVGSNCPIIAVICLAALCGLADVANGQSAATTPNTFPNWGGVWVMQGA
jgi:hypothetical protein